jgi:hypothetical protein
LAGLLALLLVQAVHPVFWTTEGVDDVGLLPANVQWKLDLKNAMFVTALLGGLTAAGLAVSQLADRGSWLAALAAAGSCACLAALFGGLAGGLGHFVFEHYKSSARITDLDKALRFQGALLAMLGGGIGLAAGVAIWRSTRAAVRCLIGGLLAGVLAGIAYPAAVAVLMPSAMTTVLIPLGIGERLLWLGLFTGLVGTIIPTVAATPAARRSQGKAA